MTCNSNSTDQLPNELILMKKIILLFALLIMGVDAQSSNSKSCSGNQDYPDDPDPGT